MNAIAKILLSLLVAVVATDAASEVRTLEAVGTVPIDPRGQTSKVPRDLAIDQALREAVIRVAQDFLADREIEDPLDQVLIDRDGRNPESDASSSRSKSGRNINPSSADLAAVLGKKMVPYTSRFRMIEDRGRRPALFADDPSVKEEYVVIVEVQVDVDRVQARLVDAGLIPAGDASVGANEILLEVEGLSTYPAYLAFRNLLEVTLGARRVTPVELSRGRTILDVDTKDSAVEFLELLLTVAPADLEIAPLHASGSRVHVVVTWKGAAAASTDSSATR